MNSPAGQQVTVFAPASIGNLGPGFDVLGLALATPGDVVIARQSGDHGGVSIREITGDEGKLPRDPAKNTAGIAATATLKKAGIDIGIELEIQKGIPIGSGLGSSAASAAAAAYAVNLLIGSPLRKGELIEPCIQAEAAVAGRHADNIAPSLLGGMILVRSVNPVDLVRLPVPDGLHLTVVTPHMVLATRDARAALPSSVPLSKMVHNMANVAAMVSACFSGDQSLLARCIVDEVVRPARAALIPGCNEVIETALNAGALGSDISGAGPSIFALCRAQRSAREVGAAMAETFRAAGLETTIVTSPANCPGARRL